MKYTNANKILPEKLINEIQKYVQGETIYIPKQETEYEKWGARSGGRRLLIAVMLLFEMLLLAAAVFNNWQRNIIFPLKRLKKLCIHIKSK